MDLIAALAVIPLATFTTLAVLGAGSGEPPEWMLDDRSTNNNSEDSNDSPSSIVLKGAQAVVTAGASVVGNVSLGGDKMDYSGVSMVESSQIIEEEITNEPIKYLEETIEEESENIFDPSMFFDDDETLTDSKPSYDEPSITGLE